MIAGSHLNGAQKILTLEIKEDRPAVKAAG
jgi:hypothetical protein